MYTRTFATYVRANRKEFKVDSVYCLLGCDTAISLLTFQAILTFLNPTGHVMHQQFNFQQLYVLPTLYLCVLYLSENN